MGLTFDIEVEGYDLLCDFVDIAKEIATNHSVTNVKFHCADALSADLRNTAIVFLDNQAWDSALVNSAYKKLEEEMPSGSLLVDYARYVYLSIYIYIMALILYLCYLTCSADAHTTMTPGYIWYLIACESLEVSWDVQKGTAIAVYYKFPFTPKGIYYSMSDYLLRLKLLWNR